MPTGRNTGLQVIHYAALRLSGTTPFVALGLLFAELPAGAFITDVDLAVTVGFGAGAQLQLRRSPGGPVIAAIPVNAAGRFNLSNATNPLTPAEAVQGGPVYLSINTPDPAGVLIVAVSFAPSLG